MSKYNSLWEYVQSNVNQSFKMTFEEIRDIAGIPIDHSFLKYKKELIDYGYEVEKISMKEQTIILIKLANTFRFLVSLKARKNLLKLTKARRML